MLKRTLLLVFVLALALLVVACGGGSAEEEAASTPRATRTPAASPGATGQPGSSPAAGAIENAERAVLFERDMPLDFRRSAEDTTHLTTESICGLGSQSEAGKLDCIKNLTEWGHLDTYQVIFRNDSPVACLTGTGVSEVFNMSSAYKDGAGASKAYAKGKERLQELVRNSRDRQIISIPTVGEESVAFVVESDGLCGAQRIPVSYHSIDFRRGNVLVRVATVTPKVFAKVDHVLNYARLIDERIRKGGETPPPASSPAASPRTTPSR